MPSFSFLPQHSDVADRRRDLAADRGDRPPVAVGWTGVGPLRDNQCTRRRPPHLVQDFAAAGEHRSVAGDRRPRPPSSRRRGHPRVNGEHRWFRSQPSDSDRVAQIRAVTSPCCFITASVPRQPGNIPRNIPVHLKINRKITEKCKTYKNHIRSSTTPNHANFISMDSEKYVLHNGYKR